MATRQKLRDFLLANGYVVPEQRIGIAIDPTDMGPADQFNHGDDLGTDPATGQPLVGLQNPVTNDGLTGDFLQYIVDLTDNAYKLEGGNQLALSLNSRMGDDGKGVPLEASNNQGAEDVFVEGSESARNTLGTVMAQYSNGYFPPQDLQSIISKDNTNPELSGKYSQELLSNIEGEDLNKTGKTYGGTPGSLEGQGAPFVKKSSQQILINRNRFSPGLDEGENGAAFAPYPTDQESFEEGDNNAGTTTSQALFGDYNLEAVSMIQDNLKSVGESILLKGAGWDKASSPGESEDPSGFEPSDESSAWMAGIDKISPSSIRAKAAYGSPSDPITGISTRAGRGAWDTLVGSEDTQSSKSFGAMTTPEVPFNSSYNNSILIAQAAAAISAMMILATDTMDMLDDGISSMINLERGPYFKGSPTAIPRQAKFALLRNMALVPTRNPYKVCVTKGFEVLFGGSPSSPDLSSPYASHIEQAPGFWLGVARKIIRAFNDPSFANGIESFESGLTSAISVIQSNDILNIMNVAATIGDVSITMAGHSGTTNSYDPVGQWNVDRLPDGPATRISKSRSQSGLTANALAWRGNAVPSLHMIPRNVIMASIQMGTLGFGQNPLKGMVGSSLAKDTYIDVAQEGPSARVPNDIVERMENLLDAEYVPFYFHDLRTNEIVAFHAFLESLSDSYQPDYTSSRGYGRIDSVKIYRTTTRSIRFTFYVASTSKEDFNDMWFKINKLTSLVYPQWTEGTRLATKVGAEEADSTFIQPFSQILGSSPIIRLRVGDVIKSNYSNFNLARIFGIGNKNVAPKPDPEAAGGLLNINPLAGAGFDAEALMMDTVFNALYGSPLSWMGSGFTGDRMARAAASQLLVNGFANPLGLALIMRELQDPDARINAVPFSITAAGAVQAAASALRGAAGDIMGYTPLSFPYLKPSTGDGYLFDEETGLKWRITRAIRVLVLSRDVVILENDQGYSKQWWNPKSNASAFLNSDAAAPTQKTRYKILVLDFNAPVTMLGRTFLVSHADLMPNPETLFNTYVMASLSLGAVGDTLVQSLANEAATVSGLPADTLDVGASDPATFMKAENNPLVKSFESTSGRGLAGVITSLSYEWLDSTNTWEIDWNSRAPKVAKISINFDAIHDIPPGIDYSGYNRAPIYNVGDTMQKIAGDPYRDDGRASHDSYKNQGRLGAQSNDPNED